MDRVSRSARELLAKGYLGKQNKGIGWVLSRKKRTIRSILFERKFLESKEKRASFYRMNKRTLFVCLTVKEMGLAD